MILPRSSSQRRIGLTISASSVPFSRSRTTDTAICVIVVCIRSAPTSPGTMKIAETRSGLYQARTRMSMGGCSRRSTAPSLVRVRISSERCAARAAAALIAEVATWGSEASTTTWTSASPRELVRATRAIADVEVLAVLERLEQLHRLDAPRLIEDGGRHVLDVGVDGPAENEQHGDRHEERQREREAVAPELDE